MNAAAGLHAGFLVRRDHKFIVLERFSFPLALVQIQNPAGFGGKVRVAGKNPAPMLPGTNGILVQPAPQRRLTQLRYQTALADMPSEFVQTPARERHLMLGRQFASQRLNLHEFWGEKTGGDPVGHVLPSPPDVPRRNAYAIS